MAHGISEHDTMFSVRETPWHKLGVVLDDYPKSIDEALELSGLTWEVIQRDLFMMGPVSQDGIFVPQMESTLSPVSGFSANVREDTGEVLGVVGKDYQVVPNRDAFAWLDSLLGTEVEFETAGSLHNGRRVWVLAKIPENVEVGGDEVERFVYCANSHDGSMAVTAAATNVRVVCANTLGWAISKSAQRSYKFRHTGNLAAKMDEARRVMEIALDWDKAFCELGDELASQPMSVDTFDHRVVKPLMGLDKASDLGEVAQRNREDARTMMIDLFTGSSPTGDTTGNSPGTKWCAANAVAEYADWFRRYTVRTDQMARSFEDQSIKQRGLDLVRSA